MENCTDDELYAFQQRFIDFISNEHSVYKYKYKKSDNTEEGTKYETIATSTTNTNSNIISKGKQKSLNAH